MSPPINFHDKFSAMAVEVRDIVPNRLLSLESEWKLPKPAVPETSLLVSHVMTEFAGTGDEIGSVVVKVWMDGWHGKKNIRGCHSSQPDDRRNSNSHFEGESCAESSLSDETPILAPLREGGCPTGAGGSISCITLAAAHPSLGVLPPALCATPLSEGGACVVLSSCSGYPARPSPETQIENC